MGLAIVELIMSVEEEFGITIEDLEVPPLHTVGDLYGLVLAKLHHEPLPGFRVMRGATEVALQQVRDVLVAHGVPADGISMDTRLEELLPVERRRDLWAWLQDDLSVYLPSLGYPTWAGNLNRRAAWTSFLGCLTAFGVAIVLATTAPLSALIAMAVAVTAWGIVAAANAVTRPSAVLMPSTCTTVADVVQHAMAARGMKEWERGASVPCRSSAAFYRLRRGMIGLAGVPRNAVRPSSRMDELLPERRRRRVWAALGGSMGIPFPSLGCAPAIPEGWKSVRDVVDRMVLSERLTAIRERWASVEVWERLRKVVVDQAKVTPAEVTEETLLDDIGMG